jgi:hypothetical protein
LNLRFNKSLLSILIKKAIGVTTKKNIIPIIIGEINFPKKIPNLNQTLFNGVKIFEFIIPKIKNNNEIKTDQIRMSPWLIRG